MTVHALDLSSGADTAPPEVTELAATADLVTERDAVSAHAAG